MKFAVITGGNGFLGKELVKALLQKGYFVYNIANQIAEELTDTSYRNILSYTENIAEQIEGKIEFFFHLAWGGKKKKKRASLSEQLNNICMSEKYVRLAQELEAKRFIYAGSIMEYECLNNLLRDERTGINLSSTYSAAKLMGHLVTRLNAEVGNLNYIPIIISNIYGETESSPRFINSVVKKMLTEDRIELTQGKQLYDFIYIDDAIEMMIQIAEHGIPFKQYYIGSQEQKPLKEYILQIKDIVRFEGELAFGAVEYHGVPLTYREFNTNAFFEDFTFRPVISFEEGIRKLLNEYTKSINA